MKAIVVVPLSRTDALNKKWSRVRELYWVRDHDRSQHTDRTPDRGRSRDCYVKKPSNRFRRATVHRYAGVSAPPWCVVRTPSHTCIQDYMCRWWTTLVTAKTTSLPDQAILYHTMCSAYRSSWWSRMWPETSLAVPCLTPQPASYPARQQPFALSLLSNAHCDTHTMVHRIHSLARVWYNDWLQQQMNKNKCAFRLECWVPIWCTVVVVQ